MKTATVILLAFMAVIAGCEKSWQHSQSAASPSTFATRATGLPHALPGLYSGVLPCADCPGIRYELDLRAPSVYYRRMTYLERDVTFDDIGEWSLTPDGAKLVLRGSGPASEIFGIEDGNTLRKLDANGAATASGLNYDITRQPSYTPLEPSLQLQGEYQSTADAGLFTECLTGLQLDVAKQADYAALEAAYAKITKAPGQRVLASVEGSIVRRPVMEGEQPRDTLIVARTGRF